MTERSQPIDKDAVVAVIERLNDEAMRLAGRGIDRGCVDSSLAANLALEAAAMLEALAQPTEQTKPCGCKPFEVCSRCEDFGHAVCHCGELVSEHTGHENHSPVPMPTEQNAVVEAARALLDRADNHARDICEPLLLEERETLRAKLESRQ